MKGIVGLDGNGVVVRESLGSVCGAPSVGVFSGSLLCSSPAFKSLCFLAPGSALKDNLLCITGQSRFLKHRSTFHPVPYLPGQSSCLQTSVRAAFVGLGVWRSLWAFHVSVLWLCWKNPVFVGLLHWDGSTSVVEAEGGWNRCYPS